MLPGTGSAVLAAVQTTLQTTFLTGVSGSNQTYNVPANFVSNVSVEVVSGGGDGAAESTDGCGNGNGDGGLGGSGNYTKTSGVSMTPGGTQTYAINGTSCFFGGTTLAGSACGSLSCGTAAQHGTSQASITGAKGDVITRGSIGDGLPALPPAAAQTARVGSGVAAAGNGNTGFGGSGGVHGIIKIINLVAA